MTFNYKTKPCKQFFELGYCSYGIRCQFSHKQEDYIQQKNKINNLDEKKLKLANDEIAKLKNKNTIKSTDDTMINYYLSVQQAK